MNIISDDEPPFSEVPKGMSFNELLEKPAYFKLKAALRLLTSEVSSKYQEVLAERKRADDETSRLVMGIRKIGNTWWFFPPAFKREFRKNIKLQAKKPPREWSRGDFFEKGKGLYYMADVCNRYFSPPHPLNVHALRKLVVKLEDTEDTRATMGIFRLDAVKRDKNQYFIEMPSFAEWVAERFG